MEKSKLLTFTVIVLLLLNLGTLAFLFTSSKGRHPHDGPPRPMPREIIIERLHLDDTQIKAYQMLIDWHRSHINELEQQARSAKNELYQLLNQPGNTQRKDSLIDALAGYQKEIEGVHFKHFEDIKKLCRKDQLPAYEALTHELSQLFSHPQKRPHE